MSSITFEFYQFVQNRIAHKRERKGQAYYNVAFGLHPHIVANTPQRIDPFYDDSKCEEFMKWLREQINRRVEISPRENRYSHHTRVINGKTYAFSHSVKENDARTRVSLLDSDGAVRLVKVIVWYSERNSR